MNPGAILPGLAAPVVLASYLWRARGRTRALSPRRILVPPLGMSTGAGMFVLPMFRVPWSWALLALATGAVVLSIPLRRATRLVREGDRVLHPHSPALGRVLLALVALRLVLRVYADSVMPGGQAAGLFFLLALGMIVTWRASMYLRYRALLRTS